MLLNELVPTLTPTQLMEAEIDASLEAAIASGVHDDLIAQIEAEYYAGETVPLI